MTYFLFDKPKSVGVHTARNCLHCFSNINISCHSPFFFSSSSFVMYMQMYVFLSVKVISMTENNLSFKNELLFLQHLVV